MDKKRLVAGVDAGSTAIKIVLFDGCQSEYFTAPSTWNPGQSTRELLDKAAGIRGLCTEDVAYIVGTGYGRVCMDFIHKDVTEITCHARGAKHMYPDVRTVVDVGGQDAKAILITKEGRVEDFVMNDKCAAGTGRFLQVMANRLGMDVSETGNIKCNPSDPKCTINSMCTVFAESEVIGLINRGIPRTAIMYGLIESISDRIAAMAAKINPAPPVVFTGGMAQNQALRSAMENRLGYKMIAPENALYAGALGAALIAWDMISKD